jgi:uncharacterized protein YjbI with pentapeptide repeats
MELADEILNATRAISEAVVGDVSHDELKRAARQGAAAVRMLALAGKGYDVANDGLREQLAAQLKAAKIELAASGGSPGVYALLEPDSRGATILPVDKAEFIARARRAAKRSTEGLSGNGARSVVSLYLRAQDDAVVLDDDDQLPGGVVYINCRFDSVEFRGLRSFEKAQFTNCRFVDCRFVDVSMSDVVFSHCAFVRSTFDACELGRGSFLFTRFERVSFAQTWGHEMSVASCIFSGPERDATAAPNAESGSSTNRIEDCRFGQLHMSRTRCFDLDIVSSTLESSVIDEVQFGRGSEFRSVTLDGTLLVRSQLSGVHLIDTTLAGALLVGVDLGDTKLEVSAADVLHSPVEGATFRDCLVADQFLIQARHIDEGFGDATMHIERSMVRREPQDAQDLVEKD